MRLNAPLFAWLLLATTNYVNGQSMVDKESIVYVLALSDTSSARLALGSGFLLDTSGNIMTAKHVVEKAEGADIYVSISSKSAQPISIDSGDIDCSENQDLCFLRVSPDAPAVRAVESFLKLGCYIPIEGESLIAAGFFAGDAKITGVVTPRGHVIGDRITGGLLPTDIAAESGMSGGPVFDSRGTVIGIVKGGSEQFSYVQPLQLARASLQNRNIPCLEAPETGDVSIEETGDVSIDVLAALGMGPDKEGNSVGGVVSQIDHGSFTCPQGQFLSGLHFYGAPESVKYCIGCFTGATAICRSVVSQE